MRTNDPHFDTPIPDPSKHCKKAYIGLGSNQGERRSNCQRAVEMVGQAPGCEVIDCSDWYLTRPVGVNDQAWYVNGVLSINTSITARNLLKQLMAIEADMGRVRKKRWEPRIIDLDILLYGREIINEENLIVPHPLMHLRQFVLVPMAQLDPDFIHPCLGVSITELSRRIAGDDQVLIQIEGQ